MGDRSSGFGLAGTAGGFDDRLHLLQGDPHAVDVGAAARVEPATIQYRRVSSVSGNSNDSVTSGVGPPAASRAGRGRRGAPLVEAMTARSRDSWHLEAE
jgi:hypothetical protein